MNERKERNKKKVYFLALNRFCNALKRLSASFCCRSKPFMKSRVSFFSLDRLKTFLPFFILKVTMVINIIENGVFKLFGEVLKDEDWNKRIN